VRIVAALPVTATDKVDKKPLRSQQWTTTDPLWHRVGRNQAYQPVTEADLADLRRDLAANGRLDLLGH
jgi:fatty-acyl-CoA synthase